MNIKYTAPKTNSASNWFNIISFEINGSVAYGVISLSGDDGFDAMRAGGLLIEQIQNALVEGDAADEDTLTLLKKALKESKRALLRMTENSEEIDASKIDVNIVLILLKENIAYFAKFDGGGIYVKRDNEIIDITNHLQDPTGLNQTFLGSGLINDNDKILLSTKYFDDKVIEGEFKNAEFQQPVTDHVLLMLGMEDEVAEKSNPVPVVQEEQIIEETSENDPIQDEVIQERKENDDVPIDTSDSEDESKGTFSNLFAKATSVVLVIKLFATNLFAKVKGKIPSKQTSIPNSSQSVSEDQGAFETVSQPRGSADENTFIHIVKSLTDKLIQLIKAIFAKIQRLFRRNNGRLKVKTGKGGLNFKIIIIAVLIVGGLLFLGGKSIKKNSEEKKTANQLEGYYSQTDEAVANATEIKDLNKTRAKSYIDEALSILDKASEIEDDQSKVDDKKSEVLGILDEINGVTVISDYDIMFDSITSYESDGLVDFAMLGSDLYILDSKKGTVYKVSSNKTEEQILDDGTFSKPYRIEGLSDNTLIVYDQEEGLIEVNPAKKEARKLAGMSTSTVGNIDELELYKLDNQDLIYSLRTDRSRVDKIQKISGGYAAPQLRLEDPSIAGAVDISIDGNIYILTNSSPGIIRYLGNNREDINIVGDELNFNGFTAFDASVYLSKFYILNKVDNKIIIVSKPDDQNTNNLPILSQLVYRGDKSLLTDMKEIHVSSDESSIYVLDGSRIIKIANK